jgi:hypothetical protein
MAAVTVEDNADMPGESVPVETVYEVSLVEAIQNTKCHGGGLHGTDLPAANLMFTDRPFGLFHVETDGR